MAVGDFTINSKTLRSVGNAFRYGSRDFFLDRRLHIVRRK
jgi:hypothetical protein